MTRPTVGRKVRQRVSLDQVDAPADRRPAAPAAWSSPPPADVGSPAAAHRGGRPRSASRKMPEYPRDGYGAYRLLGTIPHTASRVERWSHWLHGSPDELLYIGITSRAGFVRWVEHSDTKTWAGDVTCAEIIRGEQWSTLNDTVLDDRTGRPWLVFDPAATDDDGIRPIRPGERVHTEPEQATKHGLQVDVFHLDPAAGVTLPGLIAEGARTGERRLIRAERPRHNVEHNEGGHAVNRVRRRFPRLVAVARRRALAAAATWCALSALAGWACRATGMTVPAATQYGIAVAAVVLRAAHLARLAAAGAPVKPRRRRPRKPGGSRRRQRRR